MKLTFKSFCWGYGLITEADNVRIEQDITKRTYNERDENGKVIYQNPDKDIDEKYIDEISSVFYDMIYYRKESYDSRGLIQELFEKLSVEHSKQLLKELNENYGI